MTRGLHTFMQNANDDYAVGCDTKINAVSFDDVPPVVDSNMVTGGCDFWRVSYFAEGGHQLIYVAM